MAVNKELAKDLDKMLDKHSRDIARIMKRHDVDFMKLCFTYDGKITYKTRVKSHVRNTSIPNADPDYLSMQNMGEVVQ